MYDKRGINIENGFHGPGTSASGRIRVPGMGFHPPAGVMVGLVRVQR